jgi:hypothetical protein
VIGAGQEMRNVRREEEVRGIGMNVGLSRDRTNKGDGLVGLGNLKDISNASVHQCAGN